jgi:hypothetical protein
MREDKSERGSKTEAAQVSIAVSDTLFRAGPVLMLKGYRRAVERYLNAAQQDTRFGETFIPLFEALNWAVSLRDLLGSEGRPVRDRLAVALGYARDRVHHDWAGALRPERFPATASAPVMPGFALTISGYSVEWFWKPLDQLPPASGGRESAARAYTKLLEGRSAHETLAELQSLFEQNVLP